MSDKYATAMKSQSLNKINKKKTHKHNDLQKSNHQQDRVEQM